MKTDEDFAMKEAMDRLDACMEAATTHPGLGSHQLSDPLLAALLLAVSMERIRGELASVHEELAEIKARIGVQPY